MIKQVLVFFITLVLFIACDNSNIDQKHFISNIDYRNQVHKDFTLVEHQMKGRKLELFSVFNTKISLKEKEALEFLYAYMPLSDLANYDGQFFLNNVKLAFQSRQEMPWGRSIPESIFRHFVLPYRVNNENLDSARQVFYQELKPRVEKLSLKSAILEINHWCREKVIYQPTNDRTISPLGAIKSAYGRCGEESTFTVTAMRSVGIPARQCYTPRWAHSDDNHAWVEVWVDGNWHFIGACEPEPDLDIAWFSAPALRAMLVHTKVFGKYTSQEDIINSKGKYTEINVLETYAPTKKIFIKVINDKAKPIKDATVEFQLYNYAEYYPIATKRTSSTGIASLETGLGDLLIWIRKDSLFTYKKITVSDTDTLTLTLDNADFSERTIDWDLVPPISRTPKSVSEIGEIENDKRLIEEDKIREQYIASFISDNEISACAKKYNLDIDSVSVFLKSSRGNWKEIKTFIEEAAKINPNYILDFLNQLSKKDYRDANSNHLLGLYQSSMMYKNKSEKFIKYILNPRISFEGLVDYKSFLTKNFKFNQTTDTLLAIRDFKDWIINNIKSSNDNYYGLDLSPIGVYQSKYSDKISRNIFFVALCRTFGFPSRLEPASLIPQYFFEGKWHYIYFDKPKIENEIPMAEINWKKSSDIKKDIEYRVHFSLSYFENGRYNILEYGWGEPFSKLEKSIELRAGHYLLITSNRKADGSVLTRNKFFNLSANQSLDINIEIRKDFQALKVIKKIEKSLEYKDVNGNIQVFPINEAYVLAWIENGKETTNHTLKDISKTKESFEKNQLKVYLMFKNKEDLNAFKNEGFDLPSTTILGVQNNFSTIVTKLSAYPLYTLILNHNIYYLSQAYQIGIAEQLIKTNSKLCSSKTCKIDGQNL